MTWFEELTGFQEITDYGVRSRIELDEHIAVCSFLHEDIRFMSLATVYVY